MACMLALVCHFLAKNMETIELPLVAAESVGRLGIVNRVIAAVSYLIWGARG